MSHSNKPNLDKGFVSPSESLNSLGDFELDSIRFSNATPILYEPNSLSIKQLLRQRPTSTPLLTNHELPKELMTSSKFNSTEPPTATNVLSAFSQDLTEIVTTGMADAASLPQQGYCSLCAACGIGHGHNHANLAFEGGVAQFNAGGSKWSQPNGLGTAVDITYSFAPNFQLSGLNSSQTKALFKEALGVWASVAPLNFREVDDPGNGQAVDIRVEADFIDGRFGTLAFAFFPRGGDQTYDTGENWNSSLFLETAVHEIGHSLGLGHESGIDAIMNPSIQGRFNGPGSAFLLQDDINGIRSIYGNGQGSVSEILRGNSGNNTLVAGAGDDTLLGDGGNDVLDGKAGNDLIRGSTGNDIVIGSDGADTLFGGNGNDRAYAGPGNDVVFGSRGNDRLAGGTGNDNVVGGGGRDVLIGVFTSTAKPGAGEIDTLKGEQGSDTFVLGDAQKVYYADNNPTVDYALVRDFNPEEGDQLQLKGSASNYSLGSSFPGIPSGITITYENSPTKEVIAVIQGSSTFSLTDSSIRYV